MMPPAPVLKWAGGKRQLLPELMPRIAGAGKVSAYHEPFIGGGAVYFEICGRGLLPARATISDVNPNLIDVYEAVREECPTLSRLLRALQETHSEDQYYAVRGRVPETRVERAARVIYLNKTCFNGLYRENSKGGFNVPHGKYANPGIWNEPALFAASRALQSAEILCRGFAAIVERAKDGDLVYFDPPYVPLSATASFAGYAKGGFGPADQEELVGVLRVLDGRGVKFILSNSMNERVRSLYAGFRIETVLASRNVNRNGAGRGKIEEAIVTNF